MYYVSINVHAYKHVVEVLMLIKHDMFYVRSYYYVLYHLINVDMH